MFHARTCLALYLDNHLSKFDTGFSLEAVARAFSVKGEAVKL